MEIGDWLGSLIEDCGIELEIGDKDWRLGFGLGRFGIGGFR